MAIASAQSGTQTTVLDTDHALGGSVTTPGTYVLKVSLTNLVLGDRIEIRVDTKVKTGGAFEVAYNKSYTGVQSETVVLSTPIPVDVAVLCYLRQTDGTVNTFDWNLLSL